MKKNDPKQYSFEFDEKAAQEISDQIMNSYNSGCIDQDFVATEAGSFQGDK